MNIIETHDLCKQYGNALRVAHLDLDVPEGSVYGFLGPNGAGKSTTLKMILGLVRPTAGSIRVLGKSMDSKNRLAVLRQVGSLIESPSYYGHLTGEENLRIVQTLRGVPEKNIREVLQIVRLDGQRGKKVAHYSLGMKQRLGLALALVGTPDLLLLDEPFNGMDPQATRDMRQALVRLNRERGVTIVISSHVLDQLNRMATRYGVVRDGALVREITEAQVHESCGSSVRIKTADPARTLAILEERLPGANLRALPDQAISISLPSLVPAASAPAAPAASATSSSSATDPAPAAQAVEHISRILHDADQVVLELSVTERDIEDYFVELMGTPAPK